MINRKYLISELTKRGRRSVVNIGMVALVTTILICVTLLSGALEKAFQAPLNDIGANITVQKSGDVPEQMAGPVLPCSVAPITNQQRIEIEQLPGIQSVSQAVLFWDFSEDVFQIVVGMNATDKAGPALLRSAVLEGRMLTETDTEKALAEIVWAEQNSIGIGDNVTIGGESFIIAGLVDASQISQIGTANLYIPLQEAQLIASKAAGVKEIHSFEPQDSNILFIQADRDKTEDLAEQIREMLGEKTSVATPDSFKQLLGSMFNLTQRFSALISGMVFFLAMLLVVRNASAAIAERTKEIGTMKAVGWTGADIRTQLLAENGLYIFIGTVLGVFGGVLAAWGFSHITIAIPVPWDMAPIPHFLPGGAEQLFRKVQLQMDFSPQLLVLCCAVPVLLGLGTVWSAGRAVSRLQTSEVLRYE